MMKRISAVKKILICITVVLSMKITVMAYENQQTGQDQTDRVKEDIRSELLEEYADDAEFKRMLDDNPEMANEYIESLVEDIYLGKNQISILSTSSDGTAAYCSVPIKKQTKNNNCSAATILQTLCGLGKQNQVVGSTDSAKQDTIFNNYTTNKSAPGARTPDSPYATLTVGEVTTFLNRFVSTYKYKFKLGKNLQDKKALGELIWLSLLHNRPVLLHAKTGYLDYYENHNSGHYLSVDWYSKTTGEVRIKDCNYQKYGGSHIVTLKEAYDCVHTENGRYVIAGQ